MRRLIVFIACSLDGYVATASDGLDWLFTEGEYGYHDFMAGIDTVIMGRRTFELCCSFPQYPYPTQRNLVFTSAAAPPPHPRTEYVSGDPRPLLAALRAQPGKDLYLVGGGVTIRRFLEFDLVDEWVISIHPVLLGGGLPLFPAPFPTRWLVVHSVQHFPSGLVQLRYRRA